MRVDLPSGAWVDLREELKGADKKSVRQAIRVTVVDGKQEYAGMADGDLTDALLARIITAWGGPGLEGIPIPALQPTGRDIIPEVLDLDDYEALQDAVDPILRRMMRVPNRVPSASS